MPAQDAGYGDRRFFVLLFMCDKIIMYEVRICRLASKDGRLYYVFMSLFLIHTSISLSPLFAKVKYGINLRETSSCEAASAAK